MKLWRHPLRALNKAILEARYDYIPEALDSHGLASAVVFIPKRVGDGMAIFPVIRALQAHRVGTIVIVASRYNAPLFQPLETDGIDIVSLHEARDSVVLRQAAQRISDRYGRIDLCVEATMRDDAASKHFVGTLRARSNLQISDSRMRCYSPVSHRAQTLHDDGAARPHAWAALMKDAGIADVAGNYEFPIPEDIEQVVATELSGLAPYIALNMDGSEPSRQLSLAQGREICRLLRARFDLPIVPVCSPQGSEKAEALAQSLSYVHRSELPLSLQHSAAIVKHAALVVSPDTAVLHMASAYNRPALGLFARRQDRWRPLSEQSAMLVTGGHLRNLDLLQVEASLETLTPDRSPRSSGWNNTLISTA